jgi:MoaA/NifB/PqqE/SkfB family radical SAM enzyme
MVIITNRCNLSRAHCFGFRDDNPNEALSPRREPLLRKGLLRAGVGMFEASTVTTNGTMSLVDLGPDVLYVVSLDGPRPINGAVRGPGSFDRVLRNLRSLPRDFSSPVQVQCTVTPVNQAHLEELIVELAARAHSSG